MTVHNIITTERLKITPLSRAAFDKKLKSDLDPELKEAMLELLERAAEDTAENFIWYTDREIQLRQTGETIGSVALMSSPTQDPDHLIEVGYSIFPAYRCNGYMTEALNALCSLVMSTTPDILGMIAGVEISNLPSQKVLCHCGFTKTDENETIGLQIWKRLK